MTTRLEGAQAFADAHARPGIIVLPNAWDAGSAVLMADAGFPYIATTSAGVAFAHGLPDGQRLSRGRMLELVGEIVEAVDVPVTADLEAGYGPTPDDVAATVRGAIEIGAAGCNIEDSTGDPERPLFPLHEAVERIRAGAEAVRAAGVPFVLNARVDPYLVRLGTVEERFTESVLRANAYREAGAGCVYVPGVMDADTIARLVRTIDAPLNILGAMGGAESVLSVADLDGLGVRRVSIGGSLTVAVYSFARRALRDLKATGRFDYTSGSGSNRDFNELMAGSAAASRQA